MTWYFKTHLWQAASIALAVSVVLMAACGGSARHASNKPAAGSPAGGIQGGTVAKSAGDGPPAANSDSSGGSLTVQSREFAAAPATDVTTGVSGRSGAPSALPSTLDRKIIQTATLTITTDEVSKKFEDVGNIAAGSASEAR